MNAIHEIIYHILSLWTYFSSTVFSVVDVLMMLFLLEIYSIGRWVFSLLLFARSFVLFVFFFGFNFYWLHTPLFSLLIKTALYWFFLFVRLMAHLYLSICICIHFYFVCFLISKYWPISMCFRWIQLINLYWWNAHAISDFFEWILVLLLIVSFFSKLWTKSFFYCFLHMIDAIIMRNYKQYTDIFIITVVVVLSCSYFRVEIISIYIHYEALRRGRIRFYQNEFCK